MHDDNYSRIHFCRRSGAERRDCLRGPFSTAVVYPCVSVQRTNNESRSRKPALKNYYANFYLYTFSFLRQFSIQNNVDPDLHFSTERSQLKTFACIRQLVERSCVYLMDPKAIYVNVFYCRCVPANFDRANCKRGMFSRVSGYRSQMNEKPAASFIDS